MEKGFSKENIIRGFCKSGIFLPNRTDYPESYLSPQIFEKCKTWVKEGKPDLSYEQLEEVHASIVEPEATTLSTAINESEASVHHGRSGKFVTFFISDDTPGNMI